MLFCLKGIVTLLFEPKMLQRLQFEMTFVDLQVSLSYHVFCSHCRFEFDVESFGDEQNWFDVILAGVMQDASLHQRSTQLFRRNDFASQRIELHQLRQRRARVQIDEGAPEKQG